MRARGAGGVADQNHASGDEARRADVPDRLDEWARGGRDDLRELGTQQARGIAAQRIDVHLAQQRRRDALRVVDAALVGQQVGECVGGRRGAIPDPVVPALAGREPIARAGDEITEHVLAGRQAEGHAILQPLQHGRWQRPLVRQPAPRDIAGVVQRRFRHQPRAHGRAQAVGGNRIVRALSRAIGETEFDAVVVLADVADARATDIVTGRALRAQETVHETPRGHDLAHRQFADHRSVARVGHAAERLDAHGRGQLDTGLRKCRVEFVMGRDAGATAREFTDAALEHADLPARATQQHRGEQAGHRAADDCDAAA